jgi:uncharacterized DUF497 family protein
MYISVIYLIMADLRALLAQATGFEWEAGSVAAGSGTEESDSEVTRAECEQLFLNEPLVVADEATDDELVADDAARSSQEIRGHALGEADDGRLLFAAFVVRDGLIRVTGARPMTRTERQVYTDVRDEEESS